MTETRTQSARIDGRSPDRFEDRPPARAALVRMFHDALTELRIGRTIGPYRVLARIGRGGMGTVYRAIDTRLGREVALKFLAMEPGPDDQSLHRFDREARAASSVNHPNICTIHEIGDDAGTPFIVMELLKGESLRHRLFDGPLPLAQVLDVSIPIADALEAVHRRGFIHRDLTPANIFITERGAPKLLDFGLATPVESQLADGPAGKGTDVLDDNPRTIVGTPGYMSPEQIRGLPLDTRSDLFSLGAVVCEMAVGRTAFDGSATGTRLERVLTNAPRPVAAVGSKPGSLRAMIAKALMENPDQRYQTAGDFMRDLIRLQRNLDDKDESRRATRLRSRGRRSVRRG